jgi:hypothetical protein
MNTAGRSFISRQGWCDNEPVDIGPPEEPALVERALALIHEELGIDGAAVGDACALARPVFTSLVRDAVTAVPPGPKVDVL